MKKCLQTVACQQAALDCDRDAYAWPVLPAEGSKCAYTPCGVAEASDACRRNRDHGTLGGGLHRSGPLSRARRPRLCRLFALQIIFVAGSTTMATRERPLRDSTGFYVGADASSAGWYVSSLNPLPANWSENSIMWADPARNALFLIPLAWSASERPPEPTWEPGIVLGACNYSQEPAPIESSLMYLPLDSIAASMGRPGAARVAAQQLEGRAGLRSPAELAQLAWRPWDQQPTNRPSEFLWSETTLYIASHNVLFSFSGHSLYDLSNDNAPWISRYCLGVFFSSRYCMIPTYRTHILNMTSMQWTSLSPVDTGAGTPNDTHGMRYAFAQGLQMVYDPRRDRVIAFGGFLDLGLPVGAQQAPVYSFWFKNWTWSLDFGTGDVPVNSLDDSMSRSFAFYDELYDMLWVYGGVNWERMLNSWSCWTLALSSMTWTELDSCTGGGPFLKAFPLTVSLLPRGRRAAVLIGGRTTDYTDPSFLLPTYPSQQMWTLDLNSESWSLGLSARYGASPPLLAPRYAVYDDPAWPQGVTVLLWGGALTVYPLNYSLWNTYCAAIRGGASSYPSELRVDTRTLYMLRIDLQDVLPTRIQLVSTAAPLAVVLALLALGACSACVSLACWTAARIRGSGNFPVDASAKKLDYVAPSSTIELSSTKLAETPKSHSNNASGPPAVDMATIAGARGRAASQASWATHTDAAIRLNALQGLADSLDVSGKETEGRGPSQIAYNPAQHALSVDCTRSDHMDAPAAACSSITPRASVTTTAGKITLRTLRRSDPLHEPGALMLSPLAGMASAGIPASPFSSGQSISEGRTLPTRGQEPTLAGSSASHQDSTHASDDKRPDDSFLLDDAGNTATHATISNGTMVNLHTAPSTASGSTASKSSMPAVSVLAEDLDIALLPPGRLPTYCLPHAGLHRRVFVLLADALLLVSHGGNLAVSLGAAYASSNMAAAGVVVAVCGIVIPWLLNGILTPRITRHLRELGDIVGINADERSVQRGGKLAALSWLSLDFTRILPLVRIPSLDPPAQQLGWDVVADDSTKWRMLKEKTLSVLQHRLASALCSSSLCLIITILQAFTIAPYAPTHVFNPQSAPAVPWSPPSAGVQSPADDVAVGGAAHTQLANGVNICSAVVAVCAAVIHLIDFGSKFGFLRSKTLRTVVRRLIRKHNFQFRQATGEADTTVIELLAETNTEQ